MIPILYDKTGNTKITNLTDCIQCIVTEERNGMFEAELVYSVHSSNSDKLIRGNIIVADANDTLKEQKFRIYKITKPINGRIKILARHISFDMARDVVTGLVIDNQSCEYALNKLFSSSQFSQHFIGHSDIVNSQSTVINGTTHILKAIVGVEGSIIDTFGTSPEILRDNYDFYIYENRGHDNGVTIEYGKNLTGLNLDTDDSNMITRIRAIAKYRDENQEEVLVVSSPEFIDSPYINNYETPFIQEIDFSDQFKDDEVPTPVLLKTMAEEYFVNNKCDLPSENATLSFIPLSKCVGYEGIQDKISLCDTVTVIDYRYNLTTKVKVIKVSYNTLKERYENMEVGEPRSRLGDIISNSMNSVKGEKGDKGDKGDKGEDGSIGDFPDSLPTTPILTSSLYGFASIELSWTFESQPYYTYELYASKTQNFTPNEFDLLFEGKGSTFLFQAKPNETWYFRVRAVNSHGRATNFSSQVTVTTTKVDDLSNYVESAAIGEALIGTLSLDRGWVGTLKGNYIDAKQLSVTDGNGKRTLFIDSFGNISLDVTELKISSKKPATTEDIEDSANEIKNELDNLTIGGRNYILNSKGDVKAGFFKNFSKVENGYGEHTLTSQKTYSYVDISPGFVLGCRDYEVGKQVTMSYDFMYTDWNFPSGSNRQEFWIGQRYTQASSTSSVGAWRDVTHHSLPVVGENGCELNKWIHIEKTMTIPEQAGEGIGTASSIQFYNNNADVSASITFRIKNIKLEYGNRATDWTPAPEDTNNIINDAIKDLPTIDDVGDAKDSAIIASKIETIKQSYNILKSEYNKNIQQSEIIYKNSYLDGTAKTNLNTAITNYKTDFTAVTSARDSIVNANTITTSQANEWNAAITNIQTSTDTLAKRVQEAQTYIDTAIYNASVDYTDKAIPDALTGYAKTSYVDDAMEQAVNNAKDGMVSSTDLTINNTEILMSAASMGQYNLLRNSDFRNGFDGWDSWGITNPHFREITTNDISAMNGENNASIRSESSNVGNISLGNYQDVVLKPDSTYTISYWVNSVYSTMRAQIENFNSNNGRTALANKDYININGNRDRNTWKFDSITFTTPSDSSKVRVMFYVTRCEKPAYKALLVKPMLVSGNKAQAWTGHPDEIYVGVVSITEKKGLMVEHSNVNTKTVMSADGFSIEDDNGDVLAWLSSKEQWTELNVERIYAANIDNVYTKHKTLYVNHSYAGSSDGTAERPFSSFNDLNQFLKLTPTINGHVNINVLSEGTITEEFVLEGLKGSGTLNVTISNKAIFQGENTREAGIKFVDVQLTINIETSATYIDFEHGVLLYNCGVTNITGLILNVSGYGVLCNNTNAVIHHVDFCDSYCCIGSANCSNVHFYACSGNDVGVCCRVMNGGIITIGGASASTIPHGNFENQGGYIYSKENVSKSGSWNYPNTSALPNVPSTGVEYIRSYTHTSLQSYQYNWSSWSTDGSCKQGAWSHGLRGGHMFFDMATIRAEMTGTIQDGNTITLTRANSGGISGDANVYINGSNCSSASGTPNYSNNTHLGTLRWGETKTFTLPKTIVQSLINGTCNSLAVYVNSTASNNYINITNASITLKTKK